MLFILLAVRSSSSVPCYKKVKGDNRNTLYLLLVAIIVIALVLIAPGLEGYRYRITTLVCTLLPVTIAQLHHASKMKIILSNNEIGEDDKNRLNRRSALISRTSIMSYVLYIPLSLSYLELI
jgi:hypothetical protein